MEETALDRYFSSFRSMIRNGIPFAIPTDGSREKVTKEDP